MSTQPAADVDEARRRAATTLGVHWKRVLVQGALMIALGILAIALPVLTTLAVEILVGWLFLIGGVWRTVSILRSPRMPGFGWSLAPAIMAIALGALLVFRPLVGMLTLTMLLVAFFTLEGSAKILFALELRKHVSVWLWTLVSGIVDLILAALILSQWPAAAAWAIGLLVGINMLFFGMSLVMISLAARADGKSNAEGGRREA